MARVIDTLDNAIDYLNTLYEVDSDAPSSGDEDYSVWTALFNVAISLWENEEGVMWKELFVKTADAADGDLTTDGTNSYDCPTDFNFPASGYVWIGANTNKKAYKVIRIEDLQLYENNKENWCYFVRGGSPTLEFNPNIDMTTGDTISYTYYKYATALTTGTDSIEMSDPMFAVYYALSELKKEEGDPTASVIATQKLEAMRLKNETPAWNEEYTLTDNTQAGFGV